MINIVFDQPDTIELAQLLQNTILKLIKLLEPWVIPGELTILVNVTNLLSLFTGSLSANQKSAILYSSRTLFNSFSKSWYFGE